MSDSLVNKTSPSGATYQPAVLQNANSVEQESTETIARRLAYCSSSAARAVLPYELARSLEVLPLSVKRIGDESIITAAFPRPINANSVMAVRFASGMDVVAEETERSVLCQAVRLAYLGQAEHIKQISFQANKSVEGTRDLANDLVHADLNDKAIPKLLSTVLQRGIVLGASDIHIEPHEAGSRVRFRVHGRLNSEPGITLSSRVTFQLLRRVKVLAGLELNETRLPQEGGFSFAAEVHSQSYAAERQSVRLRVSILPLLHGEKLVLRLLDGASGFESVGSSYRSLSHLGLRPDQQALFQAAISADRGGILLSGPTGSGKSTLLCAALEILNRVSRNIVTLEDPVERVIPGINQTEIRNREGLGYADLLPKLLRQDPDVVMIGEIRDAQTASVALTAAITGSLVLSTVHAGSALEVFTRLFQLGVAPDLLAASVRLIASQRLVPRNCRHCLVEEDAEPAVTALFNVQGAVRLKRSSGCALCNFSGISGRTGFFELLPINSGIREVLRRSHSAGTADASCVSADALRNVAFQGGYRPLGFFVREALLAGEIPADAALKALGFAADIGVKE